VNLFNGKHLDQVEETYLEHFKFGMWAGLTLAVLSILSVTHAIFPFLFTRWPDKIYQYFVQNATARLNRVSQLLKNKNLE
jgi:hypothetical protein